MTSVAIVIPVYQSRLTVPEALAFRQCLRLMEDYPVILTGPEGHNFRDCVGPEADRTLTRTFAPSYFSGIEGYNRLMTSRLFYDAFSDYEYILLCQLDAYLFRNELAEWCRTGYDYIGAPAFNSDLYDRHGADEAEVYARALSSHRLVFNGGLSLRKVSAMQRLLRVYDFFYPRWKGNEDMLFSLDATRLLPLKPLLRLPTWQEALRFSFEKSPAASFRLNGNHLPFGCHAWQRYDPLFWKQYIPEN